MGESVRRKDHGGKRSAGGMEADCTISWSIRAVDTGIQGPAFRGKPYLLPKAAARQKNRLRLVRRSQAVVQEPVRGGWTRLAERRDRLRWRAGLGNRDRQPVFALLSLIAWRPAWISIQVFKVCRHMSTFLVQSKGSFAFGA